MQWQFAKVVLAAAIISFSSWLAGRQPRLAGFLISLPLSSMLALVFFQLEYREPEKAAAFARSIFLAIPASLLFFIPFLFSEKLRLDFWVLYGFGLALLVLGYFAHKLILG